MRCPLLFATLALRAVLAWLPVLGATGCIEVDGRDPPALPRASDQVRTVDVELMRTASRRMVIDAAGNARFEPSEALGGVEVCVIERRPAFDSFEPFEVLEDPVCETSAAGETTRLRELPADSDLLVRYAEAGFRSVLTTFRTDDHDVAVPSWADNATYFVPMLPEGDALPLDVEGEADGEPGLVALWVEAVGEYGVGEGVAQLNAEADLGVAPAEGVEVAITDGDDEEDAAALAMLATRRDRPTFLSLSPASYRARFAHPSMELVPLGVQEQYMITGLPTDRFDTIEVPVRSGLLTMAMVDGFCPLHDDPSQPFEDLATCTLAPEP